MLNTISNKKGCLICFTNDITKTKRTTIFLYRFRHRIHPKISYVSWKLRNAATISSSALTGGTNGLPNRNIRCQMETIGTRNRNQLTRLKGIKQRNCEVNMANISSGSTSAKLYKTTRHGPDAKSPKARFCECFNNTPEGENRHKNRSFQ